MKNCNCKETEIITLCKPDPCDFVYKMPVDECTNKVVYYITLASAVLMGCNEGAKTVEQELNEIKNKLIELDYINNENAWQNLINKLKLHLTDLDPELTNLIKSLIALHLDGIDYDALVELFEDKFDEWKRHLDDLLGNINNIEFDQTPTQGSTNAVTSNGIYEALGNLTDNVRMQYEELLSRNTDNEIIFPMGAQTKSIKFYQDEEELPENDNDLQIYAKFTYGYEYGVTKNNIYEITDVKDVDLLLTMAELNSIPFDGDTFDDSTLCNKYNNGDFSNFEIKVRNSSYLMYSKNDRDSMTPVFRSDGTTIMHYMFSFSITEEILEKIWNLAKKYRTTHVDRYGMFYFVAIANGATIEMNLGHGIRLTNIHTFSYIPTEQNPNNITLRNNSIYYDETHGCFFKYIEEYNYAKFISQTVTVDENSSFNDLNFLYLILGMSINIICKDAQENASRTRIVIPLTYFTGVLIQGSALTDYSEGTDLNPVVYTASFSKDESGNTVYTLNLMKLFGERCTTTGGSTKICITNISNSGNDEP